MKKPDTQTERGSHVIQAAINQITMIYIQPGKMTQYAYVARFNRSVIHEWLDMHAFESAEMTIRGSVSLYYRAWLKSPSHSSFQ